MNSLLVGLLILAQVDGGTPDVIDVGVARITTTQKDGGIEETNVEGGCWLSTNYCVGYAKELQDKRTRIDSLEAAAWHPPLLWLGGALLVGFAIGVPLGWVAKGASK